MLAGQMASQHLLRLTAEQACDPVRRNRLAHRYGWGVPISVVFRDLLIGIDPAQFGSERAEDARQFRGRHSIVRDIGGRDLRRHLGHFLGAKVFSHLGTLEVDRD